MHEMKIAVMGSGGLGGLYGGRLAHAGVAFGGRDLPAQPLPYPLYRGERREAPHVNRERRVSAVAGSGLAVLRAAFVAVGGFDEESRTAYADVDLCLAVRSRGLAILYCPASVIEEAETPAAPPEADEASELLARWTGLERDEDVIWRVDGTDLARVQGPLPPPRADASRAYSSW